MAGLDSERTYSVQRSLVARGSSNSYSAFVEMGKPQPPSAEQILALHAAGRLKTEKLGDFVAVKSNGEFAVTLPAHSICLLQLVPTR